MKKSYTLLSLTFCSVLALTTVEVGAATLTLKPSWGCGEGNVRIGGQCQPDPLPEPEKCDTSGGTCDCPDGGQTEKSQTVCCRGGKTYSRKKRAYTSFNLKYCNCPNGGEESKGTCCSGGLAYDISKESYTKFDMERCGCPAGGEESAEGEVCCSDGYAYDTSSKSYTAFDKERCGCPAGGEESADGEVCCSGGYAYNPGTGAYDKDNDACICPGNGTLSEDETVCCKEGYAYSPNDRDYTDMDPEHCGCPSGSKRWAGICCSVDDFDNSVNGGVDANGNQLCCDGIGYDRLTSERTAAGNPISICCLNKEYGTPQGCCPGGRFNDNDASGHYRCCPEGEESTLTGTKTTTWVGASNQLVQACCPTGQMADASGNCCTADKHIYKEGGYICCSGTKVPKGTRPDQICCEPEEKACNGACITGCCTPADCTGGKTCDANHQCVCPYAGPDNSGNCCQQDQILCDGNCVAPGAGGACPSCRDDVYLNPDVRNPPSQFCFPDNVTSIELCNLLQTRCQIDNPSSICIRSMTVEHPDDPDFPCSPAGWAVCSVTVRYEDGENDDGSGLQYGAFSQCEVN